MPERDDHDAAGDSGPVTAPAVSLDAAAGVELVPDRRVAAAWSAGGAALVAAAVWVLLDSRGHPMAWVGVAVSVPVAAYFLLQALVPQLFVVRLDADRLLARTLWYRVSVPWSRVGLVRVTRSAGDPILVVEVRTGRDPASPATRTVGILLPVGADVEALHAALAAHSPAPPDGPAPPRGGARTGGGDAAETSVRSDTDPTPNPRRSST